MNNSVFKIEIEGYVWKDTDSYDVAFCKTHKTSLHRLQGFFYKLEENGTKILRDAPLEFWRTHSNIIIDYYVNENKRYTFWIAENGQYPDFSK